MENHKTEPENSMFVSGMMDKFIRGMSYQLKNEAEQMYSEDMDKNIRAFRIRQFIITALSLIECNCDMYIFCELNGMNRPKADKLLQQLDIWLNLLDQFGISDINKYVKDRAVEMMEIEEKLKKEEEESKDE